MKRLSTETYTKDPLYPVVARAIAEILKRCGYVAPVDVLLQTQRITKQQYEDWRFGRVPYLERVTSGGLGTMGRILRIIELHCRKLNLKPSPTVYHKWGKGARGITLRFSKSGDPNVEAAYARHFVQQKSPPRPHTLSKPMKTTPATSELGEQVRTPAGIAEPNAIRKLPHSRGTEDRT